MTAPEMIRVMKFRRRLVAHPVKVGATRARIGSVFNSPETLRAGLTRGSSPGLRGKLMPECPDTETEIIHAAYAEKVKDAFMAFAENLAAGQGENPCRERFLRAVRLVKKARDLALEAMTAELAGEPQVPTEEIALESSASTTGGLSAEDRALIEQTVGATTGLARVPRLR